ncbi:MAG: sigma-70 RNA polymerase sigma factor region 4 domain-containing protein [Planctomycetota bacterium]|jgi:RNA polymerase sigma factor (sigma-70 family)
MSQKNKSQADLSSQILLAAQSGDIKARDLLASHFGGIEQVCGHKNSRGLMRTLARRSLSTYGIENNHTMLQDVVAEAYYQILRPDIRRYDPERGTAAQYLSGIVRNAAKKTVNMFRNNSENLVNTPEVCFAEDSDSVFISDGREDSSDTKYRKCRCTQQVEEPIALLIHQEDIAELRSTFESIIGRATPEMRNVIQRRYFCDEPMSVIAQNMGIERTALTHRIHTLLNRHRVTLEKFYIKHNN